MTKIVLILLIIVLFIFFISFIPIKIYVLLDEKNMNIYIKLFNKTIKKIKPKKYKSNNILNSNFLFNPDLKQSINKKKNSSFLIYLLLNYGAITKVTYIPFIKKINPIMYSYISFMAISSINIIKNYIDNTFRFIENDYYDIVLDAKEFKIYFEIEISLNLYNIISCILKKQKLFLNLIKGDVFNG